MIAVSRKGVLGFESPTRGWIGRSATGREKKKWNLLQNSLEMVLEGYFLQAFSPDQLPNM